MTEAHARRTDPVTSHEAALLFSGQELRANQQYVLDVLRRYGGVPDWILLRLYRSDVRKGLVAPQSDSGIRTRRKELTLLGLVAFTGRYLESESGRGTAQEWAAT